MVPDQEEKCTKDELVELMVLVKSLYVLMLAYCRNDVVKAPDPSVPKAT